MVSPEITKKYRAFLKCNILDELDNMFKPLIEVFLWSLVTYWSYEIFKIINSSELIWYLLILYTVEDGFIRITLNLLFLLEFLNFLKFTLLTK